MKKWLLGKNIGELTGEEGWAITFGGGGRPKDDYNRGTGKGIPTTPFQRFGGGGYTGGAKDPSKWGGGVIGQAPIGGWRQTPLGESDVNIPTYESGLDKYKDTTSNLDLTRQTTGAGVAGHFGYGSEYEKYFSPMQEGLLEAGTQAGWSGYKQAKRADIFQTGRRGLLDLTQQRQTGHGGFAGRGATGREYGEGRSQLSQGLMQGMFGLEQDILGKIGTAQGRIEDWRGRQQDVALRLAEMEAEKLPNFPKDPTFGQSFWDEDGVEWVFNGSSGWQKK